MRLRRISIALVVAALVATGLLMPSVSATQAPASSPLTSLAPRTCSPDLVGWTCFTLTVPRDWFGTGDLMASIALAVMPARRSSIGGLTFNPGGPGGSGLESAAGYYERLPQRIKDSFDVVAWDPRGVGASTPQLTGCSRTQQRVGYTPPATGPVDWLAFTRDMAATLGPGLQACWEANPDVAPYLGTDFVVRDLEAMREALGYEQWSIHGMSYGSRIGYRYARAYPDRVRALVLDGALDPNLTLSTWTAAESWAFTYAQAVFSSTLGDGFAARFARVLRALNARTVVIDGRTRTRWDLTPRIFGEIPSQSQAEDIRTLVDTVYRALYSRATPQEHRRAAAALARLAREDTSAKRYTLNMVTCADMSDRPSIEETARYAEASYLNNSVGAAFVAVIKGLTCEGLPEAVERPYPLLEEELSLATPPVVLNALGDTRTTWLGAQTLANYFAGSSFITYNGTQHVVYGKMRSACLNVPVTTYLIDLVVPPSATCPYAQLRPL
ncbi:MAG: hypothetical protein RL134_1768 [Actinomycetota bacterium]